jgi:hypothetical protein
MKTLKLHLPVLFLILLVVFAVYGHLLTGRIWNAMDIYLLREAHELAKGPLAMFQYVSTYFNQPLLLLAFLLEFQLFCANYAGYIAVNLAIHAVNAFMVYMLVNMLIPRRGLAILAALLFAVAVGNYGKVLMSLSGLESILLSNMYLLVLYFLIRNDFRHQGRLTSPYFLLGLGIFLLASLTRATSFSLLGCLLAYKFFFYKQRGGRAIFSANLLIPIAIGVLFTFARSQLVRHASPLLPDTENTLTYTWISFKNIFRYLTLMVFPLQPSALLEHANPIVQLVYDVRTIIRVAVTVAIISFSFFGFVFGNQAIRFFIAWTYIMLLPFTGITAQGDWLNLTHLYLTSLGFCIVLAAGAFGVYNLLVVRRWRRYVPFLVPLAYALLAIALTHQIDVQDQRLASRPEMIELRAMAQELCR